MPIPARFRLDTLTGTFICLEQFASIQAENMGRI